MARSSQKKPKQSAQSFEQLAKELGADESGEEFERAFSKIVSAKRSDPNKSVRAKKEADKLAKKPRQN